MNEIINHLWQSTAFALLIALSARALRRNSPRLRYWLWLAASLKFLIPFSLIVSTGERIQLAPETLLPHADTVVHISTFFEPASERYFDHASELSAAIPGRAVFPWRLTLTAVWLLGVFLLAARWFRRWRNIHRAVDRATRLPIQSSVPVLSSPALMEPGVFGLFRPVLLLPEGIAEKLTPKQFEAILRMNFATSDVSTT
jgi:bla regulator protein BlaR1